MNDAAFVAAATTSASVDRLFCTEKHIIKVTCCEGNPESSVHLPERDFDV